MTRLAWWGVGFLVLCLLLPEVAAACQRRACRQARRSERRCAAVVATSPGVIVTRATVAPCACSADCPCGGNCRCTPWRRCHLACTCRAEVARVADVIVVAPRTTFRAPLPLLRPQCGPQGCELP